MKRGAAHGPRLFFCQTSPEGRQSHGGGMDRFKLFRTFKERGEWVELRFMVEAMRRGYKVLKPWGDSSSFDVALYFGSRIVRVQVKCTSFRFSTGYLCQLKTSSQQRYTIKNVDFFAVYVIQQDIWYLIPARVVVGKVRKECLMICPMQRMKINRYRYECYREAWRLLHP
jgi:hypothetical protein